MKGDTLAAGGRTATFSSISTQSELENDLKILSSYMFIKKYGIEPGMYESIVEAFENNEALPELIPVSIASVAPRVSSAPAAQEQEIPAPEFIPDKPKVGYKGKPYGDKILVSRVDREHSSNLIIPDSMKSKSDIGYVVAIGNKVENIKPGQMILFDKFASHGADADLIDEDGIQRAYLLLSEYDVMLELERVKLEE